MRFAISLLHCKNVETVKERIPKGIRRRRKRKRQPDVVFKQLVVHPMAKRRRYDGESAERREDEPTTRLHICRGHFKDYRHGRGLFGKLHGIWWWESFARGNRDVGKVVKSYKVDTE
jgi:hypothetical protein